MKNLIMKNNNDVRLERVNLGILQKHFYQKVYENDVRLPKEEMEPYENRVIRFSLLPKWDVTIKPLDG